MWDLPDEVGADARPRIVVSIATSGDLMQWHVHLHVLATDGAFSDDGTFHPLATWDLGALMRLFRERLLARLVEKHAISQELVKRLTAWKHPGFSTHVGEAIPFEDQMAIEDVACYMVRGPLSLQKLVYLDGHRAVLYRGKMNPSLRRNFKALDPSGVDGAWLITSPTLASTARSRTTITLTAFEASAPHHSRGSARRRRQAHQETPLLRKLGAARREGVPRRPAHMSQLRRQTQGHRLCQRWGFHQAHPRCAGPEPA